MKSILIKILATVPFFALAFTALVAASQGVRIKDLGHLEGVRDNALIGYGIVSGLAGTGDSSRSHLTMQSIVNVLSQFGIKISPDDLSSKNVAAVMVTATLRPYSRPGDKLDVSVTSMGDARSLRGGVLLQTPLYGPDKKIHALGQGALAVGGYFYEYNGNSVQKNHPTTAIISEGAIVEAGADTDIIENGSINVLLVNPDYTTAERAADSINQVFESPIAKAMDAGRIKIAVSEQQRENIVRFVTKIENTVVMPDQKARVVINERNGTVISGGDVNITKVTVSYGDLKVSVETDYLVSQPALLVAPDAGVRTEVVPRSRIDVREGQANSMTFQTGTTVADLVVALNAVKTSTQDIISILQGIKEAGALHADLIVQ